jgi:excisionase family DNA binding protein
MEKTSLIAWRSRERKFPETEAQRRARAREQSGDGDQAFLCTDALDVLSVAAPFDLAEQDMDDLISATDTIELLSIDRLRGGIGGAVETPVGACINVPLTSEQSLGLRALPRLAELRGQHASPLLFELTESRDQEGITLQFSLHTAVVPKMTSLKELCGQLKVGRRAIMRLIRRGELRCYRIAHRYRFAVDDVKNYLDRLAAH